MPQESSQDDDSADYDSEAPGPSHRSPHRSPTKKSKTAGRTPKNLKSKCQEEPMDFKKSLKDMMAMEDARAKDVCKINWWYKSETCVKNVKTLLFNMYIFFQRHLQMRELFRESRGGGDRDRDEDPERASLVSFIKAKVSKMTEKRWREYEPLCQALTNA